MEALEVSLLSLVVTISINPFEAFAPFDKLISLITSGSPLKFVVVDATPLFRDSQKLKDSPTTKGNRETRSGPSRLLSTST